MQHTLDHYISNLLYNHECVVVPGFGAFLTRSFPAEINPATHMVRPPSKRVVFNARIQENDGLLAQHIARAENSGYRASLESIEIASKGWKKSLRSGRKVNLSGIGRLFMDDKGKLQFNPAHDVNYDVYSYGLNIFRANAMEREQEIKRSVNKAIEKHQASKKSGLKLTGKKPVPVVRKINWKPWVATLGPVAALFLVGGYLYFQNPGIIDEIPGRFNALVNQGADSSDNVSQVENNESSIGFSAAERLNKDFGPEDDVVSELEDKESDLPNIEAEETASPIESEELIGEEPSSEVDSTTKPESEKAPKKITPAESLMEVSDFNITSKPLYNVKKREGEVSTEQQEPSTIALPASWNAQINPETKSLEKIEDPLKALNTNSSSKETPSKKVVMDEPKATKNSSTAESKPKTLKAETAKPVQAKAAQLSPKGKAQIIVGAFSQINNAERYVQELQSKGWNAYMYKSGGLNRVAIGAFNSSNDAQGQLAQVKKEVNYNAWINIR